MSARWTWVALVVLGLLTGCESETAGTKTADGGTTDRDPATVGGGHDANVGSNGDVNPSTTDSAVDSGACVRKTCSELKATCGDAVPDGCGGTLDCSDAGPACALPESCGGDRGNPYGCGGCQPLPASDACEIEGAECGYLGQCGMETDCGECTGDDKCVNNKCVCVPNPDACGNRACGAQSDGCGKDVPCGPTNGTCSQGDCSSDQTQCVCPPRDEACSGQTGSYTAPNGCSYDCSRVCGATENAAVCEGAECGTARNECGEVVNCGPNHGACAGGQSCIDGSNLSDSTLPARSATYTGGYCLDSNAANLLGKYAVRAHVFREAGSGVITTLNKAQTVSLVQITYHQTTGEFSLLDHRCVATGSSDPQGVPGIEAFSPKYRNLPPLSAEIEVDGTSWVRKPAPNASIGMGTPAGFTLGLPDFCAGKAGKTVDLPPGDSRRGGGWFKNDRCRCPEAGKENSLPSPNTYTDGSAATPYLQDCRLTDADGDGKLGFTVNTKVPFFGINATYLASIWNITWVGSIRADGFHTGYGSASPFESAVIGCSSAGGACAATSVDCGCKQKWHRVQFVRLSQSASLDCSMYYNNPGTESETLNQAKIDTDFAVSFGSCDASANDPGCPEGALCRGGLCVPQTSAGACTYNAQNACPNGKTCQGCPGGSSCRSDATCWPTTTECPAQNPTLPGGVCGS